MVFKCTNVDCPYGPEWHKGLSITKNDDGTVAELNRADAYSQIPEYRLNGQLPWMGLCLNCFADWQSTSDDL